ncbi:MAG: gliding motility-associated C-terminal domain-containing protein [Flavobacteriales bacterium]|nr:gliding motility-associated C-terminal domain-containing protein [Flavobacteriales bacterium]
MSSIKHVFRILALAIFAVLMVPKRTQAAHIIGGDVYWECISSGPDAGKIVFYLTLYKDCSVNTFVSPAQGVWIRNHPTLSEIPVTLISQVDISAAQCGLDCASGAVGAVEKYVFASDPIAMTGVPPPNGYRIEYFKCCRGDSDNLQSAVDQEIFYSATMYPYNGQNMFPCYDSSPQFAEEPTSAICLGYQLRYNSNAIDNNLDSLSYEFIDPFGTSGIPIPHISGYSANQPMPGPNPINLDPVTGQMEYDAPANNPGRYTMAVAVSAWRCGQRISETIREMMITMVNCLEPNNVPTVSVPTWIAPATGSNYAVTVQAGDLVNFSLTGTDNDLSNGVPQILSFSASGSQFGTNFNNPNGGCLHTPCATLSSVTPPSTGTGSISTEFNWQTSCDHVSVTNECATLTSTYNFLFKYQDNYCPVRATRMVNVSVTVVGESIVNSPDPHCVSLDASGDVTLTWEPVTDNNVPPTFVEYVIYHSTSPNGPFQEIGTELNISTGTYVHSSANPVAAPNVSGPNYYLIKTRSGCNQLDAPIDTVASIYLTFSDGGTTANLSWNPVATPDLPSSNGSGSALYEVWRLEPGGVWEIAGTTNNLYYSDPVIWCNNEIITYRIELSDDFGCTSVSNEAGGPLNNPNQPDPQPLDSLTIDPQTGFITICWPPNTSTNVVQYNILLNPDAFAWVPMDTVYGYNNTCWTDSTSDASSNSLWYQVYATNSCGVPGIPAGSIQNNTDHHETILLQAEYDSCQQTTSLNWNRYWYWPEGVREYDIYTSIDGAPYSKIGTTADTVFVHEDLQASAEYCYIVRAVKDVSIRVTSTSNRRCIVAVVPKRPDYQYNYNTTVQTGNTGIEEFFYVDSTAGYLGFQIMRGKSPDAMSNLWFIPFDPSTRFYQYTDPGARPAFYSYYYSIIGVDNCNLNADTLNMSRTMLLEAEANPDRTNDIQWNAYEGWRGPISAYNIYRSVDGVYDYLTTVPPTQLTYTDTVEEIIIGEGRFCYYIEAVEGIAGPLANDPDPALVPQLSNSNEACALQHPNVFMPNAFMPEGVNNVFKPVTVYVNAESYLLQIYNRWGQRLFETTDPNEGWNGTYGSHKEPQGTYAYFVKFVSSKGETYTKSGTVTLIR